MNTFGDWLGDNVAELSREGYERDVRLFGEWFEARNGAALRPETLTTVDVREWMRQAQEAGQMPATINRKLSALRVYVRWAQETEQMAAGYDPLARVKAVKAQEAGPHWLQRLEWGRVAREIELARNGARTSAAIAQAARDAAIVALMRYAGLRVSEVCDLLVEDVELSERKGLVVVRHGKGNKRREVPLHAEARHAVAAWLAVRPGCVGGWLFVGKRCARLEVRGVQRRLAELGRRAGVELSPHALRHTFAKECLNAGGELTEVQRLLGHSSIRVTAIYVQADAHDLRRAVERMA